VTATLHPFTSSDDSARDLDLGARIVHLGRHLGTLHHQLVRCAADFDDSGLWALDHHTTCAGWIAERLAVAYGTAREWLRVGHALRQLPATNAAFEEGRLSYGQVRTLTRIAIDHPDHDSELVDLAERTASRDLAVALAAWCTRNEQPDDLDRRHHRHTALTARVEPDGMGVITIRLPPIAYGKVLAAIDAMVMSSRTTAQPTTPTTTDSAENASTDDISAPTVTVRRSLAQQRALAVFQLLTEGGAKVDTEVIVHVRADGVTLHDGTPVADNTVAALLPTAFIRAMVHDAEGHPIDVSCRHRHPTPRQRLVVDERQPACRCGSREFLQYHHEPPYEESLRTVLDELEHKCSRCHRARHSADGSSADRGER
jgi:hypothetical protein